MAVLDWEKLLQDRIENGADPITEYNKLLRQWGFFDPLVDALDDKLVQDLYNEVQLIMADGEEAIAEAELKIYIDDGGILQ